MKVFTEAEIKGLVEMAEKSGYSLELCGNGQPSLIGSTVLVVDLDPYYDGLQRHEGWMNVKSGVVED